MPAETGEGGLGGRGDFISGSGRDAVLSRASIAFRSRWFIGRFSGSAGVGNGEPEEDVGREGGRFCFRGDGGDPLGSGALVMRPPSLVERLGLFACVAETVCALVILGCEPSDITSSIGCGFLA